jgi:hypothetical protein
VAVVLRIAEHLASGRTVFTVAVDSGLKYLSMASYSER